MSVQRHRLMRNERGGNTHTRNLGSAGLLGALLVGIGAGGVRAEPVLNGVTIVDTQSGKLTRNQSVAIDGGKIHRSRAPARSRPAPATKVIDARGKYLVPGYLDMHVHSLN